MNDFKKGIDRMVNESKESLFKTGELTTSPEGYPQYLTDKEYNDKIAEYYSLYPHRRRTDDIEKEWKQVFDDFDAEHPEHNSLSSEEDNKLWNSGYADRFDALMDEFDEAARREWNYTHPNHRFNKETQRYERVDPNRNWNDELGEYE